MQNVIGNRETEKALQLGLLYSDEEALNIKLIDEVAKPEDLMTRAEETMKKWLKIPGKTSSCYHFKPPTNILNAYF